MPNLTDTIRILVATDNHVGYNERDAIRGDDSWKSFHEVMCLARERDVDMVLLAGDLFHENKPSRKAMYQVMRSLRMNCYGEKPCEIEMLSDGSEQFAGAFNHVNYEDRDINVAIPVFSIHGNHDDPSGEGHLAALDILQISGLINYFGRTPEADDVLVKPVLLQKGQTKLALYGLSNVRDERLFRTFRDGNVKFFRPGTQKDDWFNLMCVHQNHHAYTSTGYLPENFLPDFLHLIIWGHEHQCEIEPKTNPETGFRVMQPGSSVATSLVPGEAVPKHVAVLSVTGKEFKTESIRLKTVRPFVHEEIVLSDSREMRELAFAGGDTRPAITRYLDGIVVKLIEQAKRQWLEARREVDEESDNDAECPLPIVRLRVEYTPPQGGKWEVDNPQRYSNRFIDRVANANDLVQYYRKRATASRSTKAKPEMPEESIMQQLAIDDVKIEKLVKEFLTAQSLTILPQNTFSDAVTQFVNKDDKTAMEEFVEDSLKTQVQQLVGDNDEDDIDEEKIAEQMEEYREKMESQFAQGELKRSRRKRTRKPKPDWWNSDQEGQHWEDSLASMIHEGNDDENDDEEEGDENGPTRKAAGRGRGRGRGGKAAATSTTRKTSAAASKNTLAEPAKGRRRKEHVNQDEADYDDDDDVIMISDTNINDDGDNDDEENEDVELFVRPVSRRAASVRAPVSKIATKLTTQSKGVSGGGRQSQLRFGPAQGDGASSRATAKRRSAAVTASKHLQEPSEDEISDDDAFEPPPSSSARAGRSRR